MIVREVVRSQAEGSPFCDIPLSCFCASVSRVVAQLVRAKLISIDEITDSILMADDDYSYALFVHEVSHRLANFTDLQEAISDLCTYPNSDREYEFANDGLSPVALEISCWLDDRLSPFPWEPLPLLPGTLLTDCAYTTVVIAEFLWELFQDIKQKEIHEWNQN